MREPAPAHGLAAGAGGTNPDGERDMAINRVVIITTLFAASILFGHSDESVRFDVMAKIYILYLCCAFAIFAHVNVRPEVNGFRRIFAMAIDIGALTYVAVIVGPSLVGFLYSAYLLIVYGYGFRYGTKWLVASAAMSIFAVLVAVAVAGGDTYRANQSHALVQRAGEDGFHEYPLSPDVPIYPGDLIKIPERYF